MFRHVPDCSVFRVLSTAVFLQCCITLGSACQFSLQDVHYHGLSDLQVQNYKNKVRLKLKLHQPWRIALTLSRLQLSVFPNIA